MLVTVTAAVATMLLALVIGVIAAAVVVLRFPGFLGLVVVAVFQLAMLACRLLERPLILKFCALALRFLMMLAVKALTFARITMALGFLGAERFLMGASFQIIAAFIIVANLLIHVMLLLCMTTSGVGLLVILPPGHPWIAPWTLFRDWAVRSFARTMGFRSPLMVASLMFVVCFLMSVTLLTAASCLR
eukprot:5746415-Pyramimonas_sp.AAC.1